MTYQIVGSVVRRRPPVPRTLADGASGFGRGGNGLAVTRLVLGNRRHYDVPGVA